MIRTLRHSTAIALSVFCLANVPSIAATVFGRAHDTLAGTVLAGATVVLGTAPQAKRTTTDRYGQFTFTGVTPGAYVIRIERAGQPDVIGRLLVTDTRRVTIADLDLSRIESPDEDDQY